MSITRYSKNYVLSIEINHYEFVAVNGPHNSLCVFYANAPESFLSKASYQFCSTMDGENMMD